MPGTKRLVTKRLGYETSGTRKINASISFTFLLNFTRLGENVKFRLCVALVSKWSYFIKYANMFGLLNSETNTEYDAPKDGSSQIHCVPNKRPPFYRAASNADAVLR